jgi:hypothetical protein
MGSEELQEAVLVASFGFTFSRHVPCCLCQVPLNCIPDEAGRHLGVGEIEEKKTGMSKLCARNFCMCVCVHIYIIYSFPRTAGTNRHKWSGLTHKILILSQFCNL